MKAFLHIGAGKTGTSVIQVALAQHREALAAAGVLYPTSATASDQRAAQGQISSGNAVGLAWLLNPGIRPPHFDEKETWGWLRACTQQAEGRDLVFSSELLQSTGPQGVRDLIAFLQGAGYQPVVIFYVRHVLDHAVSVYLQHVKQGFATLPNRDQVRNLSDLIRSYTCPFPHSLAPYAALLPPDALVVRLYEAEKANLVPRFFSILTDKVRVADGLPEVINRSPSPAEQAVFERLAALPDAPQLCRALTDVVMNRPRAAEARFVVAEEDFAVFSNRNAPLVEEMNRRYLRPQDRLLLKSDQINVGHVEPPSPEQIYGAFTDYLAALVLQRPPAKHG